MKTKEQLTKEYEDSYEMPPFLFKVLILWGTVMGVIAVCAIGYLLIDTFIELVKLIF